MLKTLRQLFESLDDAGQDDSLHRQHIAVGVLLLEVARADHELHQQELDRLLQVLREQWTLTDEEASELLAAATREADRHASLHEHVRLLNTRLDAAQRRSLVTGLWEVAWADGEIHRYEEHLVRRLADLLHVPHSDFIRSKHLAGDRIH